MKISLIIPAYNEEKYIGACLQSVQKYGSGLFEVIVINNASTDRTKEIASSFTGVKVVDEMHKGLPYARNRGLSEASGDLLAYIDSDCHLHEGWFEMVLQTFNKKVDMVCFSGPYRYYDLKGFHNICAQIGWWTSAPIAYRLVGYTLLSGNFVVKRSVLESIGGFNKDVIFYGDDMNLARRLAPYGKVVFNMNFFVYSSARRLLETGIIKTFYTYAVNFWWEVLFKKPFTHKHEDIR